MASDDITRNGLCVPPLELVLDEAMNICSIPSLPRVMSTGRGRDRSDIAQDYQQIVDRYGESAATTIVNNATELLVMGGLKDADYLQKIAVLAGSLDHLGRGFAKQVLAPERIRTLWDGRALFFYRNQPPAVITSFPGGGAGRRASTSIPRLGEGRARPLHHR
jgi:type IV secretory pathway TraG/TraD family ATPase VirD4